MADENAQATAELLQEVRKFLKSDNRLSERYKVISLGQEIISILPAEHELRHEFLEISAKALHHHYEDVKEWGALETAIDYLEEIISSTDDDDDVAVARLSHAYSQCLHSRFIRGRADQNLENAKDLENAIAFAESSVESTERLIPADEYLILLADRRSNLGMCMFTKAHQTDECPPEVLDKAIAIAEESYRMVQNTDVRSQVFMDAVNNLGLYLQVRWDRRNSFSDLDRSIVLGYRLCDVLLAGAEPHALHSSLCNLAFRLQRAFKCFLNDGTSLSDAHLPQGKNLQEAALNLMTQAIEIETDCMSTKLENTLTFVMYIRELPFDVRSPMLAGMFPLLQKCVELFQSTILMSIRDDQRDFIGLFYGLSTYAAAAVLEAEADPVQALQLLELGRAIAMSSRFDANRDAADLKITDPALGESYVKARNALTQSAAQSESFDERYEKLRRFQELQRQIRTRPGLADFDRPMGEEAMKELATEGAIVVINVTDLRCDAIIVTTDGISSLPLPNLDQVELSEESWIIQTFLAKAEDRHDIFVDLWENLSDLLNLLWTRLAEPVLNQLGYKPRKSDWPHVWWVPTGILSLYPIHAAGTGLNKSKNVMNRVISSYTPTVKALGQARLKYARQTSMRRVPPNSALNTSVDSSIAAIVTMQKTPSRVDLDFSENEAKIVQSYFPNATCLREPTGEAVLGLLQRSEEHEAPSLVHISCHGETNYGDPSQSMLLMTDWQTQPLTVKRLERINTSSSGLAFLSACFVAHGGVEKLQDEPEHLACAMQVAGFAGVVGSLWDVGQQTAFSVVQDFYKHLTQDGARELNPKQAARALHLAVLRLAQSTCIPANDMKGNPVLWAPFVHFGV